MPNQTFRLNLSSIIFPFLSRFFGQSVVRPLLDMNINKYALNKSDTDKDADIPQVYFMENVLPTDFGFSSVGYLEVVSAISVDAIVHAIAELKDPTTGIIKLYAYVKDPVTPANSGDYILFPESFPDTWEKLDSDFVDGSAVPDFLVTSAFVQGRQFVFYKNIGIREFDGDTLTDVTMDGISAVEEIGGILSVGAYLICWDSTALYWSSLSDPLDLDPATGAETGAGGIEVSDLRGPIVVCQPLRDGFLIYTTNNVVSASVTDDPIFPFVFREVAGSTGILEATIFTSEQNLSHHIVKSTLGISKVDKNSAVNVYTEAADALSLKIIEEFDYENNKIVETHPTTGFLSRVSPISTRYNIISFGFTETGFTHALVHDIALEKWGRLKNQHKFCTLWPYNINYKSGIWAAAGDTTWGDVSESAVWEDFTQEVVAGDRGNKQLISFIKENGAVELVTLGLSDPRDGTFIIGKYQITRNNVSQLIGMSVESTNIGPLVDVRILTSYDGSKISKVTEPYLHKDTGNMKEYLMRVTGTNHSICFKGVFDLSSITLTGNEPSRS